MALHGDGHRKRKKKQQQSINNHEEEKKQKKKHENVTWKNLIEELEMKKTMVTTVTELEWTR